MRTRQTRPCGPLLLLALLALAPAVRADSIFFKHGTRLECKILRVTEEGLHVLLGNESKGAMIIDPATVERIEYDYDSRLDALAEDDYAGHYELGLWCLEHDMRDRALNRFLYARDKKGVPPEVHLHLGRLFEAIDEPKPVEAYRSYARYLEAKPDSEEAKAALERLKEHAAAPEEPQEKAAEAPPADPEGLETRSWTLERWGNQGKVRAVRMAGTPANQVLEIAYQSSGKDKTACNLRLTEDFSAKNALRMDIFNPGEKAVAVALAVITGGGFEWFESQTVNVPPKKWSTGLRFDFTRSNWKSKATGWRHQTEVKDLDQVRSLVILVYNRRQAGVLYVDSIHLEE